MSTQRHLLDVVDDDRWSLRAAEVMAAAINDAVRKRGRCLMALSGGSSPLEVFAILATLDVPWTDVTICQVDERVVGPRSGDRNLAAQFERLGDLGADWLPLPVDLLLGDHSVHVDGDDIGDDSLHVDGDDIGDDSVHVDGDDIGDDDNSGAPDGHEVEDLLADYVRRLTDVAGEPPVFDLVHLGLGSDGHTASLVPGDPVVGELRRYVALTAPYTSGGSTTRRLTLTRPVLDRSRMVLWLVSGAGKGPMLGRLLDGDMSIPAGLVHPPHSVVVADRSAAKAVHNKPADGDY